MFIQKKRFLNGFIKFFLLEAFLLFICYVNVYAEEKGHRHCPFKSIDEYIQRLERPERAEWQKPEKVVDYLALKNGHTVADIGAGSGYFTVIFSKRVGEDGKVYAVDIEKGMIDYIEKRAKNEEIHNIKGIISESNNPLLSKSSVDLIFICDTYHHIEKRDNYLNILKEVLKKDGRLTIIDFHAVKTPVGPPMEIRISREKMLKEVLAAGFKLEAEYYFLPYQYFLIFARE
jgi:ubiquinone/menaquinone biosynthesis C-methylase UbiE